MSRLLLAANWKMHGSAAFLADFFSQWKTLTVKTVFCVPAPYIGKLVETGSLAGAQDVSRHDSGAFTGEVSASMLADNGCYYAIIGHSERREYHGESSQLVAEKAQAALAAGVTPIVCVGETLEQRENDDTEKVIAQQLQPVLDLLGDNVADVVVAYEPVWAIGTGKTATPEMAQQVHAFVRKLLAQQVGEKAESISILYGGSVKPENAEQLFAMTDIDGGLVGGASLDPLALNQIGQALMNLE